MIYFYISVNKSSNNRMFIVKVIIIFPSFCNRYYLFNYIFLKNFPSVSYDQNYSTLLFTFQYPMFVWLFAFSSCFPAARFNSKSGSSLTKLHLMIETNNKAQNTYMRKLEQSRKMTEATENKTPVWLTAISTQI